MEILFKFFETNYVGIIYLLMSLVVIILLIQWIAWLFSIGRFKVERFSARKRSDSIRFLLTDLMVKIINDHVFLLQNVESFGQMLVAEVRLVASHPSPDFLCLIFAAANGKEFMQVVHERTKNSKCW